MKTSTAEDFKLPLPTTLISIRANRTSFWAVRPRVFLSQLNSPLEKFLRLIWAPLLLVGALYGQALAIYEIHAWSMIFIPITFPIVSWAFVAIFAQNEVRVKVTRFIFGTFGEAIFSGLDIFYFIFKGLVHIFGFIVKLILHMF